MTAVLIFSFQLEYNESKFEACKYIVKSKKNSRQPHRCRCL